MKYFKTCLPLVFLIIYWLLFVYLKRNWNEDYAIFVITLLSFFTMVICAIKNEERFMEGFIMIVIYQAINSIMNHHFNGSVEGSFLTGFSYSIMYGIFIGTSVVYMIILAIRSLSNEKKQNTK